MCTEGTSTQGPRGDGFPLRGRAFSRRDGRVWVDRALGPQSQSVPGPPWSRVALNTSGSSCTHLAPLPHHWLWCQALQRRGGGQRPDLLWQSWVLSGVAPAGACLCGVSGGGQADQWRPPAWCGGPASAHVCQASSLDPSLQEWLVDRARSGSSGSSQANTGHSPEADPYSGVQAGPLQDRHLSDCAPGRGVEGLRLSPGLLDGGQGLPEACC